MSRNARSIVDTVSDYFDNNIQQTNKTCLFFVFSDTKSKLCSCENILKLLSFSHPSFKMKYRCPKLYFPKLMHKIWLYKIYFII